MAGLVADGPRLSRACDRDRTAPARRSPPGSRWPFRFPGIAYRVLAMATLMVGAVRQQRAARALRCGSYEELASPLVMWLTAAGVGLSLAAVTLIAVRL